MSTTEKKKPVSHPSNAEIAHALLDEVRRDLNNPNAGNLARAAAELLTFETKIAHETTILKAITKAGPELAKIMEEFADRRDEKQRQLYEEQRRPPATERLTGPELVERMNEAVEQFSARAVAGKLLTDALSMELIAEVGREDAYNQSIVGNLERPLLSDAQRKGLRDKADDLRERAINLLVQAECQPDSVTGILGGHVIGMRA